jgi:DNA-binding NtrC family response regulator
MIYLIDDLKSDAMIIQDGLARHGLTVAHFANAVDFLNAVDISPDGKDVLIVDLVMPEMDGIELLQKLCVMDAGNVPVILISSFVKGQLESATKLAGGWGIDIIKSMPKPVDIDELADLVRDYAE